MHRLISFRSKSAYFTVTAAGLWASSTILQTRTTAAPAGEPLAPPRATKTKKKRNTNRKKNASAGATEKVPPFPVPAGPGPMVAVYLDQPSVEKLKTQYPEARDGQLRKVVLQYGTSASEREKYRHLFSGRAEVKVTGDASSSGRRALVVSVSHAGEEISPMSLSAAIDISPELEVDDDVVVTVNDGPGPLASAVLIQQIKQAGATKKVGKACKSCKREDGTTQDLRRHVPAATLGAPQQRDMWEGMLSPLLAHGRQFPSEEGAYVRLQEPIIVGGTICRADWVDGATTRCRDTLHGGEKRKEDWQASTCAVCKHFEASPCGDIFRRFVAASRRRKEYLKSGNKPEQEPALTKELSKRDAAGTPTSTQDDEKSGHAEANGNAEKAGNTEKAGKEEDIGNGSDPIVATGKEFVRKVSQKNGGGSRGRAKRKTKGGGGSSEGKDKREAGEEEERPEAIFQELRECSIFHDL